jgi:peptidoglycan/LPS O-acetylase OafA/YrhL
MLARAHNEHLDAARGLASIAVFSAHIGQIFLFRVIGLDHPVSLALRFLGFHSVVVFFLLSGHLIRKSITSNIKRNGEFNATEYFTARIIRIYPPLIGSILICCIVWCIIHGFGLSGAETYRYSGDLYTAREAYTLHLDEIAIALTMRPAMLQVNGPLWSLFIEFQIYILAFAAAVWAQRNQILKVIGGILALLAASYLTDHIPLVVVWIIGALTTNAFVVRYLPVLAALMLPVIVGTMMTQPFIAFMSDPQSISLALALLGFCAFYSWVLFSGSLLRFAHPLLVTTGRFSYSSLFCFLFFH